MESVNPATGDCIESCAEDSSEEVEAAASKAIRTFNEWRDVSVRRWERLIQLAGEGLQKT
jgi:Aldehyde dehydrogenase family.